MSSVPHVSGIIYFVFKKKTEQTLLQRGLPAIGHTKSTTQSRRIPKWLVVDRLGYQQIIHIEPTMQATHYKCMVLDFLDSDFVPSRPSPQSKLLPKLVQPIEKGTSIACK